MNWKCTDLVYAQLASQSFLLAWKVHPHSYKEYAAYSDRVLCLYEHVIDKDAPISTQLLKVFHAL